MRRLDNFMCFDTKNGVLACDSGVLLEEILRLTVPAGWFLPVVPGTQFVTVGGAIANDVHGKNHHRVGTFGRHVRRLELLRSSGERLDCSLTANPAWFRATIGGLGLTGIITWAELRLVPIMGAGIEVESIRFEHIEEFFEIHGDADRDFEYTVAWIDCLSREKRLGRGLFQRANHSTRSLPVATPLGAPIGVPFALPFSAVNPASLVAFNNLYFHKQRSKRKRSIKHFQSFFFPLDKIRNWNRFYGSRGFFQYQCVIPMNAAREGTAQLLKAIAHSRLGSFLAVLKYFGSFESPGLLSFPMQGTTLALDFPNRGERLERLFKELDAIVEATGGRLYPAKDGRMPGRLFRSGFPRWEEFCGFVDPRCSSTFWRRVSTDRQLEKDSRNLEVAVP
jgi:FAD/FMN-containing dehydrogenase